MEQTQTMYRGVLKDRRKYPRVTLKLPGQVLLEGGESIPVTVHDIAPDGVQIRCSRTRAQAIHPDGRSIPHGDLGPQRELVFSLPFPTAPVPVKIAGRLIYFALINPTLVAIGMNFSAISQGSRDQLQHFIALSLRPRDSTYRP